MGFWLYHGEWYFEDYIRVYYIKAGLEYFSKYHPVLNGSYSSPNILNNVDIYKIPLENMNSNTDWASIQEDNFHLGLLSTPTVG